MNARKRIGLVLLLLATPALAQAYRLSPPGPVGSLEDRVDALERDSRLQVFLADRTIAAPLATPEGERAPADPRTLEARVRALEEEARLQFYPAGRMFRIPFRGDRDEPPVVRSLDERVAALEEQRRLQFFLAGR